ncbi:MAG: hypothetical protein H7343_18650 [Undibacterium sp.]|nr:hypothetical protein [Opitutaceae bacterium]
MINEILSKKLHQMKLSLQQRNQWPIDDTLGIDPFEADVWRSFLNSNHSWVLVQTGALPKLSAAPDDEIHELLDASVETYFSRGCARPHLLWVQNLGECERRNSIPNPGTCSPLDYLEFEELIHGFSALEAMLLQNN